MSNYLTLTAEDYSENEPASDTARQKPRIRGQDGEGNGAFGASRERRDGTRYSHAGVDFINGPGAPVYALNDGEFRWAHAPYPEDSRFTGLNIKDTNGNTNLYFYVKPSIKPGTQVKKGDLIGYNQDLRLKYSDKMTNHFHFEVRENGDKNKIIDPLKYLGWK
ncbi:MAG: M23 family metallopeptidase [Alphaproteobacteria bacterium]|nr:M23 family metallopeptidase [Alphaproteobacteria bacterium]